MQDAYWFYQGTQKHLKSYMFSQVVKRMPKTLKDTQITYLHWLSVQMASTLLAVEETRRLISGP